MVRSQPGYWTPGRDPVQKVHAKILTADLKLLFFNNENSAKVFVFHTDMGRKMAAQGGVQDKILRVSMPFEKGRKLARKSGTVPQQKHLLFGNSADPWSVVLKVRFWAAQLRVGRVLSCAEIARKEGITSARVSQLWPLSRITGKRMDNFLEASKGGRFSLRQLLRFVREGETNRVSHGLRNRQQGN
jgi:hypothetical protein